MSNTIFLSGRLHIRLTSSILRIEDTTPTTAIILQNSSCSCCSGGIKRKMWYRVIRRKVTVVLVVAFVLITTKVFYSRDWGHKLPSGEVQEMPGKSATDGSDYQPLHNSRATESSKTGRTAAAHTHSELASEARLRKLRKVCGGRHESWASLAFKQKQTLSHHVIVNDQLGFLFCYVPKVACSNWKRVMMALEGRASDPNDVDKYHHRGFTFLEDFPPRGIQRRLNNYFKFMFVRDPLDRLVSAYNNKFVSRNSTYFHKRYGQRIATKYRRKTRKPYKGDDITFKEFFRYLSDTKVGEMNEHWMPYYELCQPCAVGYDFVGSFEQLVDDANKVLQYLNSSKPVRFPRKQSYYKQFDSKARDELLNKLPYNVFKKVMEKFSMDYKLFSYPLPTHQLRKSRLRSKNAKKKRDIVYPDMKSR